MQKRPFRHHQRPKFINLLPLLNIFNKRQNTASPGIASEIFIVRAYFPRQFAQVSIIKMFIKDIEKIGWCTAVHLTAHR